jgi:TRAP-type C4-dicarboxylate transport system substrate-binding protein
VTKPLVVSLLAANALFAAPAVLSAERWDMPTEQSQSSLTGVANLFFAQAVSERTGGAITIRVHFGGALGYRSTDQYDAVSTGAVVLADSYTGPLVGHNPIWQVSALPFLTSGIEDARRLYEAARPTYEAILKADGQLLLYTIPWTPSGIWSRRPIRTPADLAGLRIRTFDPLGQATFAAAGARPRTVPFIDVVPQLTTGGIEAALTSAEGGFQNRFTDLLDHFTIINYASPLSIVHMNRAVWDRLPEAHRAALAAAAAETEAMIWARAVAREAEVLEQMRAKGTKIIEASPELLELLRNSAKSAIAGWLERTGERGAAILAAYRR